MAPSNRELERSMSNALRPGTFVRYSETFDFVQDLEHVAAQVESLAEHGEAERAAELYVTFIAACHEKAEEFDDSGGDLGMFVEDLFSAWIRARQRSKAAPEDTVRFLASRMEDDPYGYCMNLDRCAAKVMNRTHLKAFAQHARAALAEAPPDDRSTAGYPRRRWTAALKRFLHALGDAEAYLELCEASELRPEDCLVLGELHERSDQLDEALIWLERGLELDRKHPLSSGYDLERRHRDLMLRLGRAEELLEIVWRAFEEAPSVYGYEEFMQLVPSAERDAWHAKAVAVCARGTLDVALRFFSATNEVGRLAERVERALDSELEAQDHDVLGAAVTLLHEPHPALAARLHRALAVRILDAKLSRQYEVALEHLAQAREAYGWAGQTDAWDSLVNELAAKHRRKSSFMPGFERLVAGTPEPEGPESMIDRARRRWTR